jgi:hypothetical protein
MHKYLKNLWKEKWMISPKDGLELLQSIVDSAVDEEGAVNESLLEDIVFEYINKFKGDLGVGNS